MVSQPHRGFARGGPLTEAEALAVAARFGVDVARATARELPGGYSNEIFRVDADHARFVVRRYGRLHVTRGAIAWEHALVAHAASAMREIVAPLREAAGETIVTAPDGGLAAVFPYIDGETNRKDEATAVATAVVLARFHRAMRDVHVAGGMRSVRFLGALPWLRERFTRLAADPLVARKLDWSALVAATTAATARVAPLAGDLPHVIVHGDVNPGNVVTGAPGRVTGLIDFDFAHESERVYDLGTFLDEFAREGFAAPLDVSRITPLLDAYHAEAPLGTGERESIPEAMLRHAATLVWYVVTRHGERIPGDVGGAPTYAARVVEIASRADEIRAAARAR